MSSADVDRILKGVREAQRQFATFSQEDVDRVLDAMHEAAMPLVERWARMAHEETGYGTIPDKTTKNLIAVRDCYRYIRPLRTVGFLSADPSGGIYEVGEPVGVVAAVVPSTNPTSTAAYKIFISLKARNGIVLSPHPSAKHCIKAVCDVLHDAACAAGAPRGLIACLPDPTIEDTQALMKHPETNVILATGGMGLVRAAYSSGKPAYGVGPGNVPAFIERTAVLPKAVKDVIAGKSFDWGTVCASEQSVIVDAPLAAEARRLFAEHGAHFCDAREKALLEAFVVDGSGNLNPKVVGRSPRAIAEGAGFSVPEETRVLIAEMEGVGREHPLSLEKLSPVLCWYEADGWEAGCLRCIEVLKYGGMGHTLTLHTRDMEVIRQFALKKPAFRILVNTPGTHGATGYTTNLPPALTLGCGALGNNITSDNITPLHLMDRKRVCFEARPLPGEQAVPLPPLVNPKDALMDAARAFIAQKLGPADALTERSSDALSSPSSAPCQGSAGEPPFDFVSEAEVRDAMRRGARLRVSRRAILTPSARELGEEHRLFDWV